MWYFQRHLKQTASPNHSKKAEPKHDRLLSCISMKFKFSVLRTALLLCKKYSEILLVSTNLANSCCFLIQPEQVANASNNSWGLLWNWKLKLVLLSTPFSSNKLENMWVLQKIKYNFLWFLLFYSIILPFRWDLINLFGN